MLRRSKRRRNSRSFIHPDTPARQKCARKRAELRTKWKVGRLQGKGKDLFVTAPLELR
jgi:hypothetical protein